MFQEAHYYAWDKRPESQRSIRRKELTEAVKNNFYENKRIPGSSKIAENLSKPETPVNRKLVAKIMKENGLKSKVVKKYKATTKSNHNLPVAENILNRDFTAEKPNQKWVSDITYVPTDEGWLYVAGILDLYGREIAGWAMDERMTKDLVIRCFTIKPEADEADFFGQNGLKQLRKCGICSILVLHFNLLILRDLGQDYLSLIIRLFLLD